MRHRRLIAVVVLFLTIALLVAGIYTLRFQTKKAAHAIILGTLHDRDGVFVDDFEIVRAIHGDRAAEVENVVLTWGRYPPGRPPSHKVVWSDSPDRETTGIILLDLYEENLSEAELALVLARFRELKWLRLPLSMSHKNRELLAPFHKLEGLSLGNGSFENGVFESVGRMKDLKWLYCSASAITNEDLLLLRGCSVLQSLAIGYTRVDDDGVAWIAQNLDELQTLILSKQTTDAGVTALERLPKLKTLSVRDSAVTDRSLETFQRMKALRYVDVGFTKVSKAGMQRFREARPDVTIDATH